MLSRQYIARATHLPYTVIMMVLGGVVGVVSQQKKEFDNNVNGWYNMDPSVLLYSIVPILVFESAYTSSVLMKS